MRYRLSIRLYHSNAPPTLWKGAFQYDGCGIQLDCQDLPSDVAQVVLAGLRRNGHYGDGCMMADGRYVTYAGRQA